MAASSIFRWISKRCSTPISLINSLQRRRNVSKMASPWLMLPPTIESNQNKRAYNFYSISQNKVISVSSEYDDKGFMIPDDEETVCLGSSHGWLALFYPSNLDLFLFNPLSRRHVKLPSLYTLPMNPEELREQKGGFVKKLIISCSPHEEDCRALMSFGAHQRLAFCCPGSREAEAVWTTIGGDEYLERDTGYTDFVYSTTHKLFYCTLESDLEVLDLRNPSSPEYIPMDDIGINVYPCAFRSDEEFMNKFLGYPLWFLVPYSGDLFMVHQFAFECVDPLDGSIVDFADEGGNENFPYKTFDFDVYKYDDEKQELIYLNCETDTLNDLAFFIGGSNHSFALSAREFPELKPNSIYFTDSIVDWRFNVKPYGGHDVGIFNYKNKTLSSCYYPCDAQSIRRVKPTPVWFTPNPNQHLT